MCEYSTFRKRLLLLLLLLLLFLRRFLISKIFAIEYSIIDFFFFFFFFFFLLFSQVVVQFGMMKVKFWPKLKKIADTMTRLNDDFTYSGAGSVAYGSKRFVL